MVNKVTIVQYVKFLTANKITPNQFLLLYLTYLGRKGSDVMKEAYASIYEYNSLGSGWTDEEVRDLINRGFIVNPSYYKGSTTVDSFEVTPKFTDAFFVVNKEAAQEFYSEYPDYLYINGKRVSAKSCSYDEFVSNYEKLVRGDKPLHDQIMKAIRIAKENDLVNMGIDKWIASCQWLVVLKAQDQLGKLRIHGDTEF